MTWWLVEVAPGSAEPEDLARVVVELTGHAALEAPERVVGYAADESAAQQVLADLVARFGPSVGGQVYREPLVDWTTAWREGLSIRTVGRLRLGPSWLLEYGSDTVVIDPEMAFGSGEHGSTRGALTLVDRHLPNGGSVLDLGSGSGILAIAAIKLGARTALGIEVDAEAVPAAEDNAVKNGVADRVRFLIGDAGVLAPLAGPADLIVSNILRLVNETLLAPILAALGPGGVVVFSGMEVAEAGTFRPVLAGVGLVAFDEVVDEGWWSVAVRRAG